MSEKGHIEYIVRGLADGLRMVDEESNPDVVVKFVGLEGLAKLVGREMLHYLADLKWEESLSPSSPCKALAWS
jgi:hypothetical protein